MARDAYQFLRNMIVIAYLTVYIVQLGVIVFRVRILMKSFPVYLKGPSIVQHTDIRTIPTTSFLSRY
jgi:hypothetical protein